MIKTGTDGSGNIMCAQNEAISLETTSKNFTIAKVLSIFLVVTGHWFTNTILWIPVTFGLFVFAFSSSFFTFKIYGKKIDYRTFWKKKLKRLGVRFWVTTAFLVIFIAINGGVIYHWHTLVHCAGLSGILNWTGTPNGSTLGAGLWFFTLLLLFYISYPFLAKITSNKVHAYVISVFSTVTAIYLESHIQVGYELWLTMLAFLLGVTTGTLNIHLKPGLTLGLFSVTCLALLALNLTFKINQFNTILIFSASFFISLWLTNGTLPGYLFLKGFRKLESCLLEIYLIHTYLFFHFTGNTVADFLLSMSIIIFFALVLNSVAEIITRRVFDARPG